MKKLKRRITVTTKPNVETLIDLGESHLAALIVLGNVQVPEAAVEYVSKARFLLAQTFESIKSQYEQETKLPFILDYLEDSFRTKEPEVLDV